MERVKDGRHDQGHVAAGSVRMLSREIPVGCMCQWSVVRAVPGAGVSELRYRHALCRHAHLPQTEASRDRD